MALVQPIQIEKKSGLGNLMGSTIGKIGLGVATGGIGAAGTSALGTVGQTALALAPDSPFKRALGMYQTGKDLISKINPSESFSGSFQRGAPAAPSLMPEGAIQRRYKSNLGIGSF